MAATVLTSEIRPTARPASVDAAFGGGLTTRQISVAGSQHFVTGSYLIVGPEVVAGNVAGPLIYGRAVDLGSQGEFCAGTFDARVIFRNRVTVLPEDITAATLVEPEATIIRSFYPDFQLTGIESWWTRQPQRLVSVVLHDRRFHAFFDRLERIESGEWDDARGQRPNTRALANARTVLRHLSGGAMVPKKVVAADGRIVVYFTKGERYSNIEILNSGVMLMLNSDSRAVPIVKRFVAGRLPSVLDQIRAHIA